MKRREKQEPREPLLQIWAPGVGEKNVQRLQVNQGKQSKKKVQDQKKRERTLEKIEQFQIALAKAECVVGIDLSITSPGMAMYNKLENKWRFVGCVRNQNQIKHIGTWNAMKPLAMTLHERPELAVQTATVHIFPECKPKDYANDTLRFEAITRELYLQIQGFCNPNKTVVVIEDYAFDAYGSRKAQMAEEMGVMQNKLVCGGYEFFKLAPKQTKMWFSGNGNATKEMMWNRFLQTQSGVDFKSLIPATWSAASGIPSPHSDLVDAFGLVYGSLWSKKTKPGPKKRRRSPSAAASATKDVDAANPRKPKRAKKKLEF